MPGSPNTTIKQCLVTLKGIESQLSLFALNSLDQEAQTIFHESMMTVEKIKKDLQNYLLDQELKRPNN
ncbi:DUF1657 domain-containing protein [Neobacillus dielmonensis]|uniref:DUF1657 domain-containing protein n=1 Tax=Neobacillus dielmonensis TaxID=1347369 RepID=UPI0005AB14B9|nr:DUF1657 domain-containing protein [Neobacillus dielmonensis]